MKIQIDCFSVNFTVNLFLNDFNHFKINIFKYSQSNLLEISYVKEIDTEIKFKSLLSNEAENLLNSSILSTAFFDHYDLKLIK